MDNHPELNNNPEQPSVGANPFFADGEIPVSVAEKSGLKHRLVFDVCLSEGIGFSEQELAANRAGYLTKEQKRSMVSIWPMITVFLFLAVTNAVLSTDETTDGTARRDTVSGLICCSLPFGLIAISAIVHARSRNPSGDVVPIRGAVFPHEYSNTRILVDGHALRLPKVTGPIFVEGDHYVIYYVPESKMIVAAERIDYD